MVDKNDLFRITNEVYRITLLFPKKEPLRYKIREVANDILSGIVELSQTGDVKNKASAAKYFESNIEIIDSFLEVAKTQNWVKLSDVLGLQDGYRSLTKSFTDQSFEKTEAVSQAQAKAPDVNTLDLALEIDKLDISDRQKRILKILKQKGKAQVWEIKDVFPDVSKRTLRRDFKQMVKEDVVERIGERNTTFYRIRTGT